MKRFTSFSVFIGIIIILSAYDSYPQVNKKGRNDGTRTSDNKILNTNRSLSRIDEQVEQDDPRNLLSTQRAKFKTIQNGAIKSVGKARFGSDWLTEFRSITTYQNSLKIKYGYQDFDNSGQLSFFYYRTYFYNADNKIAKVVEHLFKRVAYYSYDLNGKLTEILVQTYEGSNLNKTQYTYDVNGYLVEAIIQLWNLTQWVNHSKYIYTNDNNGFLIERTEMRWNGSIWSNSRKTTYLNNAAGFPLTAVNQNWQSTHWVNSSKYEYQRTASNLVSESIFYVWISSNSIWEPRIKYNYTYNSLDEPLLMLGYSWSGWAWINDYREDFEIKQDAAIMVLRPANKEQYISTFTINWLAVGTNSIDIQFSSNSGNDWITIATNLPDTGNYNLTYSLGSVNYMYMNSCKVRVRSSLNPSVYDDNYGLFSVLSENIPAGPQYYFDANKLKLPIDNRGVIADVYISPYNSGGTYDDIQFLFSSGFYLSGITNDALWGNGVLTSSLILDYRAGRVGIYENPNIYGGSSSSIPFGIVWSIWNEAVQLGASFYDGNNDGIYNPIDLNSNGIWDPNEDRPDFISDRTAWCVYNDGVPSILRRFNSVSPQGIEVQQSLFASGSQSTYANNMVFLRYRITNKGTVAPKFNDVYFSLVLDSDLGESSDDLVGCDTTISSGYTYQKTSDVLYGGNPPTFLVKLLQGPHSYIPGVTFIDNNFNQIYDDGIDTPLDTAYQKNGPYIGTKILPGAMNLPLTSFTHYMYSQPSHGSPGTVFELRNYMLGGRDRNGAPLNVCTWAFGNGSQLANCNQINSMFMYSGDPVTSNGWLNIYPTDQVMMLNTGPFTLEINKPVDIIAAYVVGRGTNPLNSLTIARQIASAAQSYYDMNFTNLPSSIRNEGKTEHLKFELTQNYPNPFNPSTSIQYVVNTRKFVTLKVYDVLGRQVGTLVNEEKDPGIYRVEFNTQDYHLASGIYLYRLQAGNYVETKKMVLLK